MKKNFYYKFLSCTFLGALGEYMVLTILSWYILETYNDFSILGKVLSFRILPRFFMGFLGGYLADRYNRRKMMIFLYSFIMLTSFAQTLLVSIYDKPAWYLLASLLFLRSIFDGAEPSVRNAILPQIVDRDTLAKAVGYYSTGLNLAAIIAPIIATFLMSKLNFSTVFWIDWFFQIPAFFILFYLPKVNISDVKEEGFFRSYKGAWKYLKGNKNLLKCMLVSITMMFFLFPFGAMLSILVKDGLGLGISSYGYLSGVDAAGAVLAGVILHHIFSNPLKKMKIWYLTALLSGVILIILCLKPSMVVIYILIFLFGLLSQLFRSFSRVVFQENTPDKLRGKIMSIIISDSGFISLGLLLYTFIAEKKSIFFSVTLMGGITIVIATYLMLRNISKKHLYEGT